VYFINSGYARPGEWLDPYFGNVADVKLSEIGLICAAHVDKAHLKGIMRDMWHTNS
jgi:hypothetical protein